MSTLNTWTLTDGTPKEARPNKKGFFEYKEEFVALAKQTGITHYHAEVYTIDQATKLYQLYNQKISSFKAMIICHEHLLHIYRFSRPTVFHQGPHQLLGSEDFINVEEFKFLGDMDVAN